MRAPVLACTAPSHELMSNNSPTIRAEQSTQCQASRAHGEHHGRLVVAPSARECDSKSSTTRRSLVGSAICGPSPGMSTAALSRRPTESRYRRVSQFLEDAPQQIRIPARKSRSLVGSAICGPSSGVSTTALSRRPAKSQPSSPTRLGRRPEDLLHQLTGRR
jgi:hypothetical protein